MWDGSWPYVDDEFGGCVEDDWGSHVEDELGGYVEDYGGSDVEDEWWGSHGSGSSEDESPFNNDTKNVEFPLSWVEGGSEVAAAEMEPDEIESDEDEYDEGEPVPSPYFRLHLVGEELSDGGSTSTAGMEVLGQVWRGALPQDLVEEVLLWLPASTQARCRAVCKAWLSLLASAEFLQRSFFHSLSRVTPSLCAFEYSDGMSEPRANKLTVRAPIYKTGKVDLSFLPQVFQSESTQVHSCSPYGLMCIGRKYDERDEMHFCVLNPVNQSFKVLPMLENYDGQAVLMTEEASTGKVPSFKVLCFKVSYGAGSSRKKLMAIYSSTSGEWKGFVARPNNDLELPEDEYPALPFACDRAIYTVVGSRRPRLVELSTEKGSRYLWDRTLPFERNQEPNEFYLADYRGRLLCCCWDGIWMLDKAKLAWIDVVKEFRPETLLSSNPAKKQNMTLEKVQVAGDLVVFFHQVRWKGGSPVDYVAYNMLRRCWQKIWIGTGKVEGLFQAIPNLQL